MTDEAEKSAGEKFAQVFGNFLMFGAGIIVLAPLGASFGALAGWTTGMIFGETILGTLGKLGLHDVAMWQLGATGGFLSTFLRTKTSVNAK